MKFVVTVLLCVISTQFFVGWCFDIAPHLNNIQNDANELSVEINQSYRSYENNACVMLQDEAQKAQNELTLVLGDIHSHEVELRVDFWLAGSTPCYEEFTAELNGMIRTSGNAVAECSRPHDEALNEVTRQFFGHLHKIQFITVDLLSLTVTSLTDLNPLYQPDVTVDALQDKLAGVSSHFHDETLPALEERFQEFEAGLFAINEEYNTCLHAVRDEFSSATETFTVKVKICA